MKCYTSELGTLLQLEAALKTKKLATPETGMIAGVPTVVYNDVIIFKSVGYTNSASVQQNYCLQFQVYSKDKADKSRNEFAKVLCEEIESTVGVRPNGCS